MVLEVHDQTVEEPVHRVVYWQPQSSLIVKNGLQELLSLSPDLRYKVLSAA
jgi:hypothetical protein